MISEQLLFIGTLMKLYIPSLFSWKTIIKNMLYFTVI